MLEIAMELERVATHDEYFVRRGLYPNVDFYSGIVLRALGVGHIPDIPVCVVWRAQEVAGLHSCTCPIRCRPNTQLQADDSVWAAADPSLHVHCAVCCRAHSGLGEDTTATFPVYSCDELIAAPLPRTLTAAFNTWQVAHWKEMAQQQQALPKISRPRQVRGGGLV